jgi:hypothetical protein
MFARAGELRVFGKYNSRKRFFFIGQVEAELFIIMRSAPVELISRKNPVILCSIAKASGDENDWRSYFHYPNDKDRQPA